MSTCMSSIIIMIIHRKGDTERGAEMWMPFIVELCEGTAIVYVDTQRDDTSRIKGR